MSRSGTVDRRRFIGLGLAAAGGAVVAGKMGWGATATLRWEAVEGFPDGPNVLVLDASQLADGARVSVEVEAETPRERRVVASVDVEVNGGEARIPQPLVYPYDTRVAGAYRYHGVVRWQGGAVRTARPATFAVRRVIPFA